MVGQVLSLYTATQASRLKHLTSKVPLSTIRRYSNQGKSGSGGGIDQERARSTAEEFKRVAEEKGREGMSSQTAEEKSREGLSSQTAEKARDGAEEATVGSSKPQHVKEAYKRWPE